MNKFLCCFLILFSLQVQALDEIKTIDLSPYFKDYRESTFVLYDTNKKHFQIHNPELAEKRRSPCSTFKIPNSLIGLDSGVIKDQNHLFKWDGTKRWNEHWNKDHTLKTAFKQSAVWYYQELARQVGTAKMRDYLNKLNYGNKDISGGINQFWLGDSLEISAMEQIRFLQKLYFNNLPIGQRNIDIVKDIMIYKTGDDFVLRGKTGSGWIEGETQWGWYGGYLETGEDVYIFAANIEAQENASGRTCRGIVINILKEMKLMD